MASKSEEQAMRARMEEDDTATVLSELKDELAMLRGIRDAGLSAPILDFEQQPPSQSGKTLAPDEFEEAMARRQDQMRSSEVALSKRERMQIEASLEKRDSEAREDRQDLLRYLETLRERQDETGESLRGIDFSKTVDKLALEARQHRSPSSAHLTGSIAGLLAAVNDPKLREELLEVCCMTACQEWRCAVPVTSIHER